MISDPFQNRSLFPMLPTWKTNQAGGADHSFYKAQVLIGGKLAIGSQAKMVVHNLAGQERKNLTESAGYHMVRRVNR